MKAFTRDEQSRFERDGFLVVPALAPEALLDRLRVVAEDHLARRIAPFELEADVHYPGAPDDVTSEGGDTLRRLLHAWERDPVFREWGAHPGVVDRLEVLLGGARVMKSPSHHNCVMTKMPRYSSRTGWHRDVRYWSFSDRELINSWLALGPERNDNGGLRLIPGSHRMTLGPEAFDDAQFLRENHPDNAALIDTAVQVDLAPGDTLFFHAACLHAAGDNRSDAPKLAVVMSYHGADTVPLAGTRSARLPEIDVSHRRS